jgi:hypothetical protein
VVDLPIEDRLLHYFLAMGAQQAERSEIPQNNLAFISGSEKIHVVILRSEDFVERNRVIEAILSLTSLRNSSQLLYLAAPRLLGASIDAAIFRPYGIGLLLFDERRIDEAVAPQLVQPTKMMQQISETPDPGLFTELATLKSMYTEMERTIATLRDDLKTIRRNSETQTDTREPTPSRIAPHEPIFASSSTSESQLPAFFTNNPWLDVLSKRGRYGDEPIAG